MVWEVRLFLVVRNGDEWWCLKGHEMDGDERRVMSDGVEDSKERRNRL